MLPVHAGDAQCAIRSGFYDRNCTSMWSKPPSGGPRSAGAAAEALLRLLSPGAAAAVALPQMRGAVPVLDPMLVVGIALANNPVDAVPPEALLAYLSVLAAAGDVPSLAPLHDVCAQARADGGPGPAAVKQWLYALIRRNVRRRSGPGPWGVRDWSVLTALAGPFGGGCATLFRLPEGSRQARAVLVRIAEEGQAARAAVMCAMRAAAGVRSRMGAVLRDLAEEIRAVRAMFAVELIRLQQGQHGDAWWGGGRDTDGAGGGGAEAQAAWCGAASAADGAGAAARRAREEHEWAKDPVVLHLPAGRSAVAARRAVSFSAAVRRTRYALEPVEERCGPCVKAVEERCAPCVKAAEACDGCGGTIRSHRLAEEALDGGEEAAVGLPRREVRNTLARGCGGRRHSPVERMVRRSSLRIHSCARLCSLAPSRRSVSRRRAWQNVNVVAKLPGRRPRLAICGGGEGEVE